MYGMCVRHAQSNLVQRGGIKISPVQDGWGYGYAFYHGKSKGLWRDREVTGS